MPDYSNLSVLIVDPNQGMRASLHNMLSMLYITKVDDAVSAGTAIRQLSKKSYDVILCEYDLGNASGDSGQDGQQLLEDLRNNKVIAQWTIFIMLTSEGVYGRVIGAAELLPTDYILKPFTVETLSQRFGRALDRRAVFLPVYQQIGQGKVREAVASCLAAEIAQPRYAADFARLRAELLQSMGQIAAAELAYASVLQTKQIGWAQLGQARCLHLLKRHQEAQAALEALIASNPKFMAAYDLLSKVHRALGNDEAAKQVLQDAIAISPHMVGRLRSLGEVALATGDVEGAEKAYKQVVAKARYSEFRDPEDHLNLVRTLVTKGDANGAAGVVRDMERSLRSGPSVDVCRAFSSALVQELNGNAEGAVAELTTALAALGEARVSNNLKLGLAQSLMSNQMDDQANALFSDLTADASSGVTDAQVVALCEKAGRADLADRFGKKVDSEVDAMVRKAAEKSRAGDLKGAVAVMQEALRRRPDNTGLWTVAVTAMLRQIGDLGWDGPLAAQAAGLLKRIREDNPNHPLLAGLIAQYQAARQKYNVAPPATAAPPRQPAHVESR
jgi:tetratricopeptide (TPR) repeat protein